MYLPLKGFDELGKPENAVGEDDVPIINYDELRRVISASEKIVIEEFIPDRELVRKVEITR